MSAAAAIPIRRALISVSDKQGLVEFAQQLARTGVELFSTGGTRQHLEAAGLTVRDVAAYTGFPEMMDGRVKTLHPKVFAGILCRHDRPDDMDGIAAHGIAPFELVVVNLYPFAATIARPGTTWEQAIEQIDIGGPSLVRAAAKNHAFTAIVTESSQYQAVLGELAVGGTTLELRRQLAAAAFAHTAAYDRVIADYFANTLAGAERLSENGSDPLDAAGEGQTPFRTGTEQLPATLNLAFRRHADLRYGENPHQPAALYVYAENRQPSLVTARQINGKELSYNNLLDLDSAWKIVRQLPEPACAVIKHNNPCGAGTASAIGDAVRLAMEGDPVSAFGSILAVNRPLDAAAAAYLATPGLFVEAIVAPTFTPDAVHILTTKPKWRENVRLLEIGTAGAADDGREFRPIDGGLLVQVADSGADPQSEWRVVTQRQPTDQQLRELEFAWQIVRQVKSNAIVVANGRAVCGVGAGQMSRVDSVEIAIAKSAERARGAVLASDAFFPFPDSIEKIAAAGIAAVIQPGGSKKDADVIAACDQHGIAMVFTGRRHFRH